MQLLLFGYRDIREDSLSVILTSRYFKEGLCLEGAGDVGDLPDTGRDDLAKVRGAGSTSVTHTQEYLLEKTGVRQESRSVCLNGSSADVGQPRTCGLDSTDAVETF